MTEERAMAMMKEQIGDDKDLEMGDGVAEDILCDFLITLGHKDLIDLYHKVWKWYA